MPEKGNTIDDLKNWENKIKEEVKTVFETEDFSDEQIKTITNYINEKTNKKENKEAKKREIKKIIWNLFNKIKIEWKEIEEAIKEIEIEENELKNWEIIIPPATDNNKIYNEWTITTENNNIQITEETKNGKDLDTLKKDKNWIKSSRLFDMIQGREWLSQTIKEKFEWAKESLRKIHKAVTEAYKKIAQKYKVSLQEIEQKKYTIPEDTIKKLTENNINVDEYIQYTISRDKITELWGNDNTPETKDFLKNLKNLEDSLWIRKETTQWLPLSTDRKTFENNPQLRAFKDNDPEIAKLGKTSYIWTERIELDNKKPEELKATIAPYQKMEEIYKDHKDFPKDQKFQDISKKINEWNFTELKQEDVDYYTQSLDKLNWWITNYIKASAAQAPLTWILRYLDSYTWLSKESIQDQFWASNKEYITMEDQTMRINWVIWWNPLSFYYDVKDWQTKISCDDVLHVENDIFQIYNGQWEYPKSDLRINMPSIKDVVDNLQKIDQKTYTELLQRSNNLKEFQRSIADLINNQIKETFPDNDEIKTRMWRFTEKNLAAQAFDSALIWRTEYKNKINEKKENWLTPIKKVLLLVDNTTEKSTATELIEFRWAMKKLEWLLLKSQEEINKIKDPVLKDNLLKLKKGKENQNYEEWEKSITTFFTLFERKDPADPEFKIDIDDFSKFIDLWTKDEETKKSTLESFTPEFLKAYNKLNPETKKIEEQWRTIKERAETEHEKESEEADEELTAKLEMRESTTEISFW